MNPDLETVKKKILPTLKQHDVVRAGIFGSYVRGEIFPDSDFDLLIEFKGEKSLLNLVALKLDLEEILGRTVDVLTYRAIHPKLKSIILREEVQIL